jgi:outer membrane lipoprotein LolB
MSLRSIVLALAVVVTLSGCATMAPSKPAAPASAELIAQRQRASAEWWSQYDAWSFSGRAAISKGDKGGSGRIEWQQRDLNRYEIALSAPVTRQSWRLIGDLHSEAGRIEGLEGGPRDGEFAEDLLLDATGWAVPLQQLGSWVRGGPAAEYPVESIVYDAEGRPASFRQAGWTVRYTGWRPGPVGAPDLPAKIEAESGDARVRLAIEDWTFASP